MSAEVADHLRRAKSLIATPKKWKAHSSTCLPTVIDKALRLTQQEHEAVCVALELAAGAGDIGLVAWSRAPERTHAEVMEAFDKAIAAEEPPVAHNSIVAPAIVATVLLSAWIVLYVALAIFGETR